MGSAIWSADPLRFKDIPARFFVAFFHNHGFLQVRDQPRWLVVQGGSQRYVEKLIRPFQDRIRLGCPVQSVYRYGNQVAVRPRNGDMEKFDHCVIAAHSVVIDDIPARCLAAGNPARVIRQVSS